jgi:hypothetical protein
VILGPIYGAGFAIELSATLTRSRTRLTAELANVLISIRRRRAGAEGEGSKPSIDDFRFRGCQFASTAANQHSVLVIHVFLLSSFGPFGVGPKLLKRSVQPCWTTAIRFKWWRRQGATLFQQPCPHSPMEASPSLFGQVVLGTVHKVVVLIPPPTRSISS